MIKKAKKVFISVGEQSGDMLGYKLMAAMRKKASSMISHDLGNIAGKEQGSVYDAQTHGDEQGSKTLIGFCGIGGHKMEEFGMKSLFSMQELSVIGFLEVIPRIWNIMRRLHQTVDFISESKPDMIITIDAPGFHSRLIKHVRKLSINVPIIHYVAPTVWAYSPERAKLFSQLYDHMILILPFEKQYFDAVGMPSTFIGHPSLENSSLDKKNALQGAKKQSAIQIVIMLGSRDGEIKRHLPEITKTVISLSSKYGKDLTLVFPTLRQFRDILKNHFNEITENLNEAKVIVTSLESEKNALIASSDVAIVKSGTVVIDLLKFDVPMVVIYKLSWLSAWFIKRKLKIEYIAICNIVAGEKIVPELLQSDFTYKNILMEIDTLLNDKDARNKQIEGFKKVKSALLADQVPKASDIAADLILSKLIS